MLTRTPSESLVADGKELVCPEEAILDYAAVRQSLFAAVGAVTGAEARRATAVSHLLAARSIAMGRIAASFAEKPTVSRPVTRSYAWLTDSIVSLAYELARGPLAHESGGGALTIVAVGGYGRGEMAAFSDVDLLFLIDESIPEAQTNATVEAMLYVLWDLRLKIGHATRSIRDCLKLAREDYTIRTSLVEARLVAGPKAPLAKLRTRLWRDLFKSTTRDFIEAKLAERAERHRKQGGQRYVVEPNVKEGKGGLRDLQSLYWIGKYVHGVDDVATLVGQGVFTNAEYRLFTRAEDFLWAVRCHLHLLQNRAGDQLTFDMQVEVAERMGYADRGGRRAVEHFMQDYFRHATAVGDLTRIFLTAMEATHAKRAPLLQGLLGQSARRPKVKDPYTVVQNRIAIADEAAFLGDKLNLLMIFSEALKTGLLLHPDAMRTISASLHLIDRQMRESKEANTLFLKLLLKYGNPERVLRRMNELGVLAAFIPEFEPIVAMMQFNMYHSYTVDEHTIQCISQLAQIERGELTEDLPVASSILAEGVNRKVLYTALLLHDIGKGREEDHSVLGAKIARKVARRLGLTKEEVATVEWLVRHHLLMSDMAQKRDIADPRTVRDFAKAVQTGKRLDLLTVLTVCDIRGVGPDTWNNWKAVLIRALYRQTRRGLEDGLEALNRENRGAVAKAKLRVALEGWTKADLRMELARHYPPYWQGLHVTAHAVIARLLNGIGEGEIRIDLEMDQDRDATRAVFVMEDHPGIFSRITGALALVGANVVDARTFTTKDGFVTSAFWIQDGEEGPYAAKRLPRLKSMIERTLRGELLATDALADKDKLKKREKPFSVPTSILFDNEGSDIYTIIEVDTRDRPGLLHDLMRILAASNISVASAVIATYGAQAVDSFYVKDTFGLKLEERRQKLLEVKLREAIALGRARAEA
ncbi:MAG: [protein-PII] uridylyltransferase [Pseudomonadota bacterium]